MEVQEKHTVHRNKITSFFYYSIIYTINHVIFVESDALFSKKKQGHNTKLQWILNFIVVIQI